MNTDPMIEIRASFFVECEELIESLLDALAILEEGSGEAETVNVVFRAVHSIKGGAAAFGLAPLVAFAHRLETVLDQLRCGELELTPAAMRLFVQAADLLHDHVRAAATEAAGPGGDEQVLAALEALVGRRTAAPPAEVEFTPTALDLGFGRAEDQPVWLIRLRPHARLYASGNETLFILRALASLGEARITCEIPSDLTLSADSAETPALSWAVELTGDIAETDIRETLDFITDVCDIEVRLSPRHVSGWLPDDAHSGPTLDSASTSPFGGDEPLRPSPASAPSDDLPPAGSAAAPDAESPAARDGAGPASSTIRVDLERVDRLVNLVGELVINQAMLAQSVADAGMAENASVMNGLEEFMMLTRDIQDGVMMIRAQPVKPLFQRMARIIREASAATGKEVRLRTEGDATEVDKTLIERLSDPLTHMIRNAVDHGIETPERRLAAGKSATGTVSLSAFHRSGRIMIEVADDGGGIDRRKVREIAVARGLVSPDAILGEAETDNLLFMPGFSTTSTVSALSGRGVGMDVLKSAIAALGGRVTIFSEPGRGTRFSVSLPLTLAVLDGMVVRVCDQALVLPLSAIVETASLRREDIRRIGPTTEVLHIRGNLIPLFDLGVQLGYRPARTSRDQGIVILTAQDDNTRVALVVDAIMEQRQVVIKGLGRSYGRIPGVAAATILGDGQVALILDPSDLTRPPSNRLAADVPLAG